MAAVSLSFIVVVVIVSPAHDFKSHRAVRRSLARWHDAPQLFVDTVGIEEHYEKKLQMLFPSINCTVRKKADFIYPIVSAGSIGAKVTRDRRMEDWDHPPGELLWDGANKTDPGSQFLNDKRKTMRCLQRQARDRRKDSSNNDGRFRRGGWVWLPG